MTVSLTDKELWFLFNAASGAVPPDDDTAQLAWDELKRRGLVGLSRLEALEQRVAKLEKLIDQIDSCAK